MNISYLVGGIFVLSITLILYTVGVWAEWFRKKLQFWHVACMLVALIADAAGTGLMEQMAESAHLHYEAHTMAGIVAILILFVHCAWAIGTYVSNSMNQRIYYTKFSRLVWLIWLVPYILGVYWGYTE